MIEIHLDMEAESPIVEILPNGFTKLVMSPEMSLDAVLHLCGPEIPEDIGRLFRSLFTGRDTLRDFELVNGKLVVRPALPI